MTSPVTPTPPDRPSPSSGIPLPPLAPPRTWVLVPVKDFSQAKRRLESVLDGSARAELARRMGARVLAAAAPAPVAVVCDSPEVAAWAEDLGAEVIRAPGRGLNGAVGFALDALSERGCVHVVISHADLPFAHDLARLVREGSALIVADRHGRGTNVLSIPTGRGFTVSFGRGSAARHRREARARGLEVVEVHDAALSWDVDRPEDLHPPAGLPGLGEIVEGLVAPGPPRTRG